MGRTRVRWPPFQKNSGSQSYTHTNENRRVHRVELILSVETIYAFHHPDHSERRTYDMSRTRLLDHSVVFHPW